MIPEIKSYSRDIIPNISYNTNDRVSIARKYSNFVFSEYVDSIPEKLTFGVSWVISDRKDEDEKDKVDLDAYAMCLDENCEVEKTKTVEKKNCGGKLRFSKLRSYPKRFLR